MTDKLELEDGDSNAADRDRSDSGQVDTDNDTQPNDTEPYSDELPEDLQPALADQEEYIFPNNNRRRIPGYLYLGIAAGLVAIYFFAESSTLVNAGLLFAAAILALLGLYSLASGWDLKVDERDALVVSIKQVGFPVGHASAQMGWRGVLSRPCWRILVYSADEPPSKRGLVVVDGVDGEVHEFFVEDNPEDWSEVESAD